MSDVPARDIFAFVFNSGFMNYFVSKPTHKLHGLSCLSCPSNKHFFLSIVFEMLPTFMLHKKINMTNIKMSKNNIYQKKNLDTVLMYGSCYWTRLACTLWSLFLYLNSWWKNTGGKKRPPAKLFFSLVSACFPGKKGSKIEHLLHLEAKPKHPEETVLGLTHCFTCGD